ncbi:unnamed protein product [Heligmosomoides polygyrus]|uniref:Uncharacterized protein n=1 Tax=Heligmosomoides polygyrus TaxID=6339 RepID=A0A183FLN2_HELPZ|nr:unnamed protein product [Heligmosomoides polygyrus]
MCQIMLQYPENLQIIRAQHPLPHGPLAEAAIAGIQDVAARSTTHRQQPPARVSRKPADQPAAAVFVHVSHATTTAADEV